MIGNISRIRVHDIDVAYCVDGLKDAPIVMLAHGILTLPRFHVQQKSINFWVHGGQHERRERTEEAIHRGI